MCAAPVGGSGRSPWVPSVPSFCSRDELDALFARVRQDPPPDLVARILEAVERRPYVIRLGEAAGGPGCIMRRRSEHLDLSGVGRQPVFDV